MNPTFVIEVQMYGRTGWIKEEKGEMFFVDVVADATHYPTELDAKCAAVYIEKQHNPTVKEIK